MDLLFQILLMWRDEAVAVAIALGGVVAAHYLTRLWSAPADIALAVLLAASIPLVGLALYGAHLLGLHLTPRALGFIALYIWCVLGMVFFAARNTHRIKLLLGLASQAGICYALFVFL